ncbi:MAG: caspase family protein [Candidatus Sericytochromatia bacterium]|nr:caspase family protein [Candidatus Tanganyikabacteria bacterium]
MKVKATHKFFYWTEDDSTLSCLGVDYRSKWVKAMVAKAGLALGTIAILTLPSPHPAWAAPGAMTATYSWEDQGIVITLRDGQRTGSGRPDRVEVVDARSGRVVAGADVRRGSNGALQARIPAADVGSFESLTLRILGDPDRELGTLAVDRRPALAAVRSPITGQDSALSVADDGAHGSFVWGEAADRSPGSAGARGDILASLAEAAREELERRRALPSDLGEWAAALTRPMVKDEFETSAAFATRVQRHNAEVAEFNQARSQWLARAPRKLSAPALAALAGTVLGERGGTPYFDQMRYDADRQTLYGDLGPRATLKELKLPGTVAIQAAPDLARQLKASRAGLRPRLAFDVAAGGQLTLKAIALDFQGQTLACVPTEAPALATVPAIAVSQPAMQGGSALSPIEPVQPTVAQDPGLRRLAEQLEKLKQQKTEAVRTGEQAEELRQKIAAAERELKSLTEKNGGPDDLPDRLARAARAAPDPHKHLLAIGISDYKSVPAVPFADRAVDIVARSAEVLWGVPAANRVVLANTQATLAPVKGQIKRVARLVGPEDTLYFYFAGHGAPSRDGRSAYLLPQDADETTLEEDDVRVENVLATLAGSRAKRIVVILDACFSGRTGPQALLFKGVAPVMVTPTSAIPDPRRITVLAASEGNQFANEYRPRSQRLFTYYLIDALLAGEKDIPGLAARVRKQVAEESRRKAPVYEQTPTVQGQASGTL